LTEALIGGQALVLGVFHGRPIRAVDALVVGKGAQPLPFQV